MADVEATLVEAFRHRLYELMHKHSDLIDAIDEEEAQRLGRQAAEAAVAPVLWRQQVGDVWDTETVREFLGISRQALYKRARTGSVLGLPGRGTTLFPVWQFDLAGQRVRPAVADVVEAFRARLHDFDAHLVASWARTDQPELGMTPEEWLVSGKNPDQVVAVARHAARDLAA